LFLIFWVQSWDRIGPDVLESLEKLKQSGKVAMYSLSTHNRPLAIEAIETDWNPVMVRHSVAHRGAEDRIFPKAREKGTTIITFNNTCYGRILRPDDAVASAADCYRYTLAQPGVTVCLSAPATVEQLEENLQALRDPALPAERIGPLRNQGDRVYQEDAVFRKLVRSR
jgi:aryl-alcohol dehydrogenase-like predicted oxidoreductase